MKETDLNVVHNLCTQMLQNGEWLILDYVPIEIASMVVTNIYTMADYVKGFGQDIPEEISVISSERRISVIAGGTSSFMKSDAPIVQYDDLVGDINEILTYLEAAIQRLQDNMGR